MPENDRERGGGPEIATGTLAEIYAQQGLHARALEIYRRIAHRSPPDERLAARIAELERAVAAGEDEEGPATPPEAPVEARTEAPVETPPAAPPATQDDAFIEWLNRR